MYKAIVSDEGREQQIRTEICIPKSVGTMTQPCLIVHFRLNTLEKLPLKLTLADMWS